MSTAHTIPHSASELHPIPGTEFVIFGFSNDYPVKHHDELAALANEFNAAFAGNHFVAHRDVANSHPLYADVVLFIAGFAGV